MHNGHYLLMIGKSRSLLRMKSYEVKHKLIERFSSSFLSKENPNIGTQCTL